MWCLGSPLCVNGWSTAWSLLRRHVIKTDKIHCASTCFNTGSWLNYISRNINSNTYKWYQLFLYFKFIVAVLLKRYLETGITLLYVHWDDEEIKACSDKSRNTNSNTYKWYQLFLCFKFIVAVLLK